MEKKIITKTVWILSLVSLLTDTASEMLYPVMPIFLKSIGFSVVLIGVLEGLAEATAGLSKGYFGKKSDITGKRVPFVQLGYALSALSKPMMALFASPLWIFIARTTDRLGKGIRTGARDAILSNESTKSDKGKVFGFHRSMDTLGAVIGPSLALVFLYYYPQKYQALFLMAFIPGALAIISTLRLKEKPAPALATTNAKNLFSFISYWKESPEEYRRLLKGLLAFTLFNSSDVFLLLKAKQAGIDDITIIGIYIFYNLSYAVFAFPVGIVADKVGLKRIFISGIFLFAVVYAGIAVASTPPVFFMLFLIYGLYAATTEGISKAWISNISEKKDIATAIGTYSAFQSILTILASSATGIIWHIYGASYALGITAMAALIIGVYFMSLREPEK